MHFSRFKLFGFIIISRLVHASTQSEDTNHNNPVIDLAKKCLDNINKEDMIVRQRNGSYSRLTEMMRSYLIDNTVKRDDKIYSFCRQKKQANFDDNAESVYERGEYLRSEEQRYRLIKELYLAKMRKKINRLNNLPKCSLTQKDKDLEMHNDKQIVFKFFDERLQEVIILCYAIAQEYSACVTKPGIADKYPSLLFFGYESHCANIEACIDKLRSIDPISEGFDCTIENESERNCVYLHSLKSLIDLLNIFGRELIHLKKELAESLVYEECLVALQKMLLMSEYLKAYDSSKIYFAIQIKFLGKALKEEQSPLYIFKAIEHMKDKLLCQTRESRRAAYNLSQEMTTLINNGVDITPNTDIYHVILYICDALQDTNLAKCFDDLITTFCFDCSKVSEPLNPQKKVCCIKSNLPRHKDYIATINTFYKLAIEENARQSEKKSIDAEIANTLIHLKFAIFEFKKAIFLLKSTSEKKMCLQYQNLVNSLSDKIQNAFGTANALLKRNLKDDMLYNDSRKLIIDVLTRQTTGLLHDKASTWNQGSDSSMMQELTDEFTMATNNPPKYHIHFVRIVLLKQCMRLIKD